MHYLILPHSKISGMTVKNGLRTLEKSPFEAFKDKIEQIVIILIKKTIFATL